MKMLQEPNCRCRPPHKEQVCCTCKEHCHPNAGAAPTARVLISASGWFFDLSCDRIHCKIYLKIYKEFSMAGKKKKHSVFKTILKVLLVLLLIGAAAAGVYLYLQNKGGNQSPQGQNAMLVTQDYTAVVKREDISLVTEGNGILKPAEEKTVISDHTLVIDSVEAEVGDSVSAGDLIARIDPDSIDDAITVLEGSLEEMDTAIATLPRSGSTSVTSPVTGRVRRIFAEEDDLLSDVENEYGGIMEIAAAGQLKVSFEPTADTSAGMEVTVHFENDDEEYEPEGIITEIEDGIATAVFDDSADYDVDLEASVYDKADHLLGTGLTASRHPYLVEGDYGVVDDIKVSEGDRVEIGTTLLTRTESAYNDDYHDLLTSREDTIEDLQEMRRLKEKPVIEAAYDGILSAIMLQDRAPITEDAPMYTLMKTDRFKLEAQVDELDIDGVKPGQTAVVVFDAFEDREYTGEVSKVSSLGQNVNGVTTYTVTIDLEGKEEFKTAMSATASITTREEKNVLTVPVDAVQTKDEKKVVTVLSGEDLSESEDRDVTLGLVNNTTAEITEGLNEGETVLVIGTTQLEDMMNMMRGSSGGNYQGGES